MMKKLSYIIVLIPLLIMIVGCHREIPEPETKYSTYVSALNVQASGVGDQNEDFIVKHIVKGNDVFFECLVKEISFRDNGGMMKVYVDGKQTRIVKSAAFVIKGLSKGQHHIKLQLYKPNDQKILAERDLPILVQ
jgi:hypothetical protein